MVDFQFYSVPFLYGRYYRWEDLEKYYNDPKMVLDIYFRNPKYTSGERKKILDTTSLNKLQKNFLAKVYDIDYLVLSRNGVYLVEEKETNIYSKHFHQGNFIYLKHHTGTQYENLKKAEDFGIQAGILLKLTRDLNLDWSRLSSYEPEPDIILKRYYPIHELTHLKKSNETKIPVDDFICLGRELGNPKTKNPV